jgi:hypothetical protein
MKCAFCGEENQEKLLLSTRVIGDKVEHVEMCFGCWWVERFEWEKKVENESRIQRKELGKQNAERTMPRPTKPSNL